MKPRGPDSVIQDLGTDSEKVKGLPVGLDVPCEMRSARFTDFREGSSEGVGRCCGVPEMVK